MTSLEEHSPVKTGVRGNKTSTPETTNSTMASLDTSDNHPLMKRFQDTLQKHLLKHRGNLIIEQQEMTKEIKLKTREREEIGVRLFELQKAIAKQHSNLDVLAQLYQKYEPQRSVLEDNLVKVKDILLRIQDMVQQEKKDEFILLRKIDVLNSQCHKLTSLQDTLKSDVTALRLATRKSSSSFTELESNKEKQDEHINRLLLAVHSSQEKLVTYKGQIDTLNEEISTMKSTLSAAKVEIETIDFEGKHLLEQWHKSLDKMRTRDETLSALQESMLLLQESLKISRNELKSFEKSILKEEAAFKTLNSLHLNLDSKIETISKQMAECFDRRQELKLELTTLRCTVEQTQHSVALQLQDKSRKELELGNVVKTLQEVVIEKQRLQDELREQYLSYNFSDKSLQNILKESVKSREQRKSIKCYRNKCQSDLTKAQSDRNENEERLIQLDSELMTMQQIVPQAEQKNKDREVFAKQLSRTIDRRQLEVNKLRHKLDKLNSQAVAPDQCPIELQIVHLQRSLAERMSDSHTLQGAWLRQQTSLVELSQRKERCLAEMRHLQSQAFIYAQKKFQIEGEINCAGEEFRVLQRQIENLHVVISKLNLQSFRDHSQEESLQSITILSEDDLLSRLKAREKDLLNVKAQAESLREEEDVVSQKLLDAENELSLWQQKYVLMKQVKSAVDSEYKKGEIHDLQNNLHKMQVQYSGLCKQQSRLVQGMEKAVHRWDVLLEKGERKIVGGASGFAAGVKTIQQRQVEEIRSRIKFANTEAGAIEDDITNVQEQLHDVDQEIEDKQEQTQRFLTANNELKTSLESMSRNRLRKFEEVVTKQRQSRAYQGTEKPTFKPLCATKETLEYELAKHKTYSRQLINVTRQLSEDFPDVAVYLNKINLRHSAQITALGIKF